jgi:hypothetical protein
MKKKTVIILLYAASILCILLSFFTDAIIANFVLTSLSIIFSLLVFKILKKEEIFINR